MDAKDFAEAFLGRLASIDFHLEGSFDDYLALPDAARNGDEANIVDSRITRVLIEALGYSAGEITYNQTKDNIRPDFVVRIRDYPGACFVVEDKATTEPRLETHRPQLASYMAAHRCPRGLLVNGRSVLGFDDAGQSSSAALSFSVAGAVKTWMGRDLLSASKTGWAALPQADKDTLSVIARRYGRDAFQSLSRLIDDLTLDRDGQRHAEDGSSWIPSRTRLPLTDARDGANALVETIQELIAELREDVAVQFTTRSSDHDEFQKDITHAPGSSVPAATVIADIAQRVLAVLPSSQEGRRDSLRTRLIEAMRGDRPVTEIDEVVAEIGTLIGRQTKFRGDDALTRGRAEARSFAGRYARHLGRARDRHVIAVRAVESFERWRAAVGTLLLSGVSAERVRDEYFAQTAYLVIVRMLLVRVLEDKGLTPRVFTNGGAAIWFKQVEPHYFSLSIGRSAARLLEIAYENAQATYAHFYGDHRVFDWYVPDRITVIRVLHRLAGFDLAHMDRDIIGTVYGRFVNERHKHEQGMYYTPRSVVSFILDRIGWHGSEAVGARILDPACGSGAFLVEAARRAIEAHRNLARREGHAEIPPERIQHVLDGLREGIVGFDLNPFACALTEINLLIQVLDLVAHALTNGELARLDRFRIYTTDALRLMPGVHAAVENGLDQSEIEDLPPEEQAKAKLGEFAVGFDAVVGNPPYVRADEGAEGLDSYREQIRKHPIEAVKGVLTKKWDLFIPFVSLGLHLLRRPGGKLGVIVSNAVETVPYAEKLREQLVRTSALREVHFFERNVKLFEDAAVRNTIIIAEAATSGQTLREWHGGPPPFVVRRQRLCQEKYEQDVFRPDLQKYRVPDGARSETLKHVCYVSVGMVLSAHEKIDGGIHKGSFKLDDLLADSADEIHNRPYVGSEDLRLADAESGDTMFAPARVRYLEYGTSRVPALIRRPTFPELYDREKVMVGEFGGALHDDGGWDSRGFLTCNHSIFLFLPWHLLAGVRNRSLRDRELELQRPRETMEHISGAYPLPFLTGLFNSGVWQTLLLGSATTSIAGRAQPNNYADQRIPEPSPELATAVGNEARAAASEGRALRGLLVQGWARRPAGWRAPATAALNLQRSSLAVARARWGLSIERPTARCDTLTRDGVTFLTGQRVAARLPEGTDPLMAEFLLRLIAPMGKATLQSLEAEGFQIPVRPQDVVAAERQIQASEQAAMEREQRILGHRDAIDGLLEPLFETIPHPPIEVVNPNLNV